MLVRTTHWLGGGMGLFFRSPKLQKNERVIFRLAANHEQADIARGGRLSLTSRRLVFNANRIDHRMGGRDWATPLDTVKGFGVADRAVKQAMAGGLRRRLRVVLADGSEELFVVRDAEKAVQKLRQLIHDGTANT